MTKSCPSCQQPVAGRFCSECGTQVAGASCASCQAELRPGARFCNQCGTPADAAATPAVFPGDPAIAGPSSRVPWIVAAVAVAALAGVILVPRFQADSVAAAGAASAVTTGSISGGPAPAGGAPFAGGAGDARSVDLSSMTPREAADRLFDRIMRSVAAADTAAALAFVPMAIDAYGRVPDLDADAHYHLAVLHLLRGEPAAARAEAATILEADPNHLFGLFTAAQAEAALGNRAEATRLFQTFLDRYPTEIVRDLPEYTAHSPAFPELRAEAQAFVGGR